MNNQNIDYMIHGSSGNNEYPMTEEQMKKVVESFKEKFNYTGKIAYIIGERESGKKEFERLMKKYKRGED